MSPPTDPRPRLVAALIVAVVVGAAIAIYLLWVRNGLSKEEFIARSDQICRDHLVESEPIDTLDLAESTELYDKVAASIKDQLADIERLGPPDDDAELLDEWFQSQRQLRALFIEAGAAARSDDGEAVEEIFVDLNEAQARSTNVAAAYGFEVCGLASE